MRDEKLNDPAQAQQAKAYLTHHVMVDLETLGTGPAAFPIAIGAVKFDPTWNLRENWEKFYVAVDPRQGPALGIDIKTVMWWMEKAQREALDKWLAEPKVSLTEALQGFAEWYGDVSLPTWSRGPAFDAVILETAYKFCGFPKRPWSYQHDRDCRTIGGLVPSHWHTEREVVSMKHDALGDAENQTDMLLAIAHELGLTLR